MSGTTPSSLGRDFTAGIVVYFVALPLCLGVALASNAPPAAGLVSGVIGALVVGALSGSHTLVTGPAAGLTVVVVAQLAQLGSLSAFAVALVLAGLLQILLGAIRAGSIASFVPSSVSKGLLAGIGVLLVIKSIPHVLGHDTDVQGEAQLEQAGENMFSAVFTTFSDIHPGAAALGVAALLVMWFWNRTPRFRRLPFPAPLVIVLVGIIVNEIWRAQGSAMTIGAPHLVDVPVAKSVGDMARWFTFPDWSRLFDAPVFRAALTVAIVATLETLVNLDAIDQLDPKQRKTPPNRELVAQGVGNTLAGLLGAIPMTCVVARSSINIHAGAQTKASTLIQGAFLFGSVALMPTVINRIPLSVLASILLVTGLRLASWALFRRMWHEGWQQFAPFIATVLAIVFTDLLTGILTGLAVATAFILRSNFRRPLKIYKEKQIGGDLLRIELANQVSFLNRATLEKALHGVPRGGQLLLDARNTHYIDPDVLDLIEDFRTKGAPAHDVTLSLLGFKDRYAQLEDAINYIDHSSREVQSALTPRRVLELLREGNARFLRGEQLTRDLHRQIGATAPGQAPMAVILSCIDSRTPAEHIFDLGIGDIFSVRIAGHVTREKVLASIEYSCKVAGAKLIVVMGHTSCGAVTSAVKLKIAGQKGSEATGCDNLDVLMDEIQIAIDPAVEAPDPASAEFQAYADDVAHKNVLRTIDVICSRSQAISGLLAERKIAIVGAMYDVHTGKVEFIEETIQQGTLR